MIFITVKYKFLIYIIRTEYNYVQRKATTKKKLHTYSLPQTVLTTATKKTLKL